MYSLKLVPHIESREKPKKEADHSRLVGGNFNKKGTYEACLGQPQN